MILKKFKFIFQQFYQLGPGLFYDRKGSFPYSSIQVFFMETALATTHQHDVILYAV